MVKLDRSTGYALGILGGLGLIIWLFPYLRHGLFGFGYDTGLYRRYLLEPLVSLPNTPVPGLDHTVFIPRLLIDAVHVFIANPDLALIATYISLCLIAAGCVFVFARSYVKAPVALAATLLYLLSAIQFAAYDAFLFKQVAALPLLLLCLLYLERGRYALATAFGIAVVLTHQTSSILLLAIMGAACALYTIQKRTVSLAFVISGTIIAGSYLVLHPHVARKLASPPVGIFFSQNEYLVWAAPILILAAIGLWKNWRHVYRAPVLCAALGVCAAFVVFHLPFYSRVYVFFDLFLIVPAVLGIEALLARTADLRLKFLTALCVLAAVAAPVLLRLHAHTPDLTHETQQAVLELSKLPKDASIITSPNLMPWVHGWSHARVYAPGLLKEPHSSQEWLRYWSQTPDGFTGEFLATFPAPVYIFARPQEHQYIPSCATEISLYLYTVENCL